MERISQRMREKDVVGHFQHGMAKGEPSYLGQRQEKEGLRGGHWHSRVGALIL